MNNLTDANESTSTAVADPGPANQETSAPKTKRQAKSSKTVKAAKKAKPPKKGEATKKAANQSQPAKKSVPAARKAKTDSGDRQNKKAEVIAMMQRAKGATLPEIMELTGWQKHTVRGFVSILGSKGGHTIESSKNPAGERTYKIAR